MAEVTVDTADLATLTTLARELGVGRTTMIEWRRRYDDFPKPVINVRGAVLYSASAMRAWCEANVA